MMNSLVIKAQIILLDHFERWLHEQSISITG